MNPTHKVRETPSWQNHKKGASEPTFADKKENQTKRDKDRGNGFQFLSRLENLRTEKDKTYRLRLEDQA